MLINKKHILLSAKIISALVIVVGLPFYLGYGNPLPFINPNYQLWDNLWLSIFPLMFLGLGLGWRWPKIGGWLVTLAISLGLIIGYLNAGEVVWLMLLPLVGGVLFLLGGYRK